MLYGAASATAAGMRVFVALNSVAACPNRAGVSPLSVSRRWAKLNAATAMQYAAKAAKLQAHGCLGRQCARDASPIMRDMRGITIAAFRCVRVGTRSKRSWPTWASAPLG